MIKFSHRDIFEVNAQALVNPINTKGAMGKGLALKMLEMFPEPCRRYQRFCKQGKSDVGIVTAVRIPRVMNPRVIIHFPTKDHWKNPSRLEWIEAGLGSLTQALKALDVESVAIPALGCGEGGLEWNDVKHLIIDAMKPLADDGLEVFVMQPR